MLAHSSFLGHFEFTHRVIQTISHLARTRIYCPLKRKLVESSNMQLSPLSVCLVTWLISLASVVQCDWQCHNDCVIEMKHIRRSAGETLHPNRDNCRLGVPELIKNLPWRDIEAPDECLIVGDKHYSYQAVYRLDKSVHSVWVVDYIPDNYQIKRCGQV